MGDVRDRAMALAALVEAFGVKDFTPVRTRAYDSALADLPIPLLNAAVRRAIQTRTWFPKVAELLADAETCRKDLLEAHPYEACAACNGVGRVRTGYVQSGPLHRKPVYGRCKCWTHYQAKLAELGVSEKPVAQLPAAPVPEEDIAPMMIEDAPPALTDRLRTLAAGKVLR